MLGIEVKSGATVPLETFRALESVGDLIPELVERLIVHGGMDNWRASAGRAVSFRAVDTIVLPVKMPARGRAQRHPTTRTPRRQGRRGGR